MATINYQLILLNNTRETNFVTLAVCKKLGLKLYNVYESINSLNNINCLIKHGWRLQIKSRVLDFKLNLHCLVPTVMKDLPSFSIQVLQLLISKNFKFALLQSRLCRCL